VAGFNSFFFAADLRAVLHEEGRVAKPGARVVIQVMGRPERNDLQAMKVVARRFFPPPPADTLEPPKLWQPGVLEEIAAEAGMTPEAAFDLAYAFQYSDEEALGRLMLAHGEIGAAAGPDREDALRAEIVEALAPYRTPSGGYRLENAYHYVVARA